MNIAEKLLELRISSGKSQAEFAKLAGVSQRTWSSYESGQSTPKNGVLWALAVNGFIIDGLTLEPAAKYPRSTKAERELVKKNIKDLLSPKEHDTEYIKHLIGPGKEYKFFKFSHERPVYVVETNDTDSNALVMIPVYSQRAAGGAGQPPTQLDEVEAYIPVVYELLGGANPKNCGIVRVVGDSMSDMTLFNGDYVIFDRSQLEGNGVYVISMGGDVRVKRLEYRMFEKKIIISSENQKSYPNPEIISFEQAQEMLVIHGKVISWVHRHPY